MYRQMFPIWSIWPISSLIKPLINFPLNWFSYLKNHLPLSSGECYQSCFSAFLNPVLSRCFIMFKSVYSSIGFHMFVHLLSLMYVSDGSPLLAFINFHRFLRKWVIWFFFSNLVIIPILNSLSAVNLNTVLIRKWKMMFYFLHLR